MKLNFESDTFAPVKRDMNFVLQRLLGNMQEKGAVEGSMTVKIDVSFDTEYIPNYDPNIKGQSRKIEKPKFKHVVTSALQIKDKKTGNMDTDMELVFDEDTGEYVIQPIANTQQRSIFDSDFGLDEHGGDDEKDSGDNEMKYIPGPTGGTGDVIDVEIEEEDIPEEEYEDVTDELIGDDDEEGEDYGYEDPAEDE